MSKDLLLIAACAALMAGCASTRHSCAVPNGVECMSIDEVYRRSESGQLKETKSTPTETQTLSSDSEQEIGAVPRRSKDDDGSFGRFNGVTRASDPILSNREILRICIFPWEDGDGDLNDVMYVYTIQNYGRWRLKNNFAASAKSAN